VIRISDEVREAQAVVALETTLVAHGFPPGEGVEVGLESERQVRAAGAVPATVGVLDGEIVEQGTMAQVFTQPTHPYTQGLVATARIDAVAPGERLPTVEDFYAGQAGR